MMTNLEKIAALFPECITESRDDDGNLTRAVNFDILKEILGEYVSDNPEHYQFTWVGKSRARLAAQSTTDKTLRPCPAESLNWDSTENLYIEGDNLDVLKILLESYLHKVKMIYIDPPYNTGNDFIYKDDFTMDVADYNQQINLFDDDGNKNFKQNNSSNPRFHSDWCSMIFSRLLLAKHFLADDGVIFISIDDNEQANLKKICDEVFGERNFIENIIWKKRYGGGAKEKYLVSLQEYILVYCKEIQNVKDIFVPLSSESAERYYSKRDKNYNLRGGYRTHPLEAGKVMDSRPNLIYPIPAPDGSMIMPKRQWLWSKERTYAALKNNELEITRGKNGEWVVSTKQYLKDELGNTRMTKMFSIIEDIFTQHGTNEVISIFGNAKIFSYPKPSELIKNLIQIVNDKDAVVMDFFSGSATTAHAVMQLNAEDGGRRKFIMVQLPEVCAANSEAAKAGYKNICEIGKERIRRAGQKILAEKGLFSENLDVGFRVFKPDSSNMKDVYRTAAELTQEMLTEFVTNIKEDRTALDLLFGYLLKCGVEINKAYTSEQVDGFTIHNYNDGELIACFDENVSREVIEYIADKKPVRAVFRDSSFATSPDKINANEIFKYRSPDTRFKVF